MDFKNLNVSDMVEASDDGQIKPVCSGHLDYRGAVAGKVLKMLETY